MTRPKTVPMVVTSHVVSDGRLVTGQHPLSPQATAEAFLGELELAGVVA